MTNINFIAQYMPAVSEIDAATILSCKTRLAAFIRTEYPDMDLSPNTIIGDLIVTPMAATLAAFEIGMGRFMSDLDLANVANGTVYNCDFVTQYLNNFGVQSIAGAGAVGVVRIELSENKYYTLDRSTKFSIGEEIYSVYIPGDGAFEICPVNLSVGEGVVGAALRENGLGTFYADIPVVGEETSDSAPVAGTTVAGVTQLIPELLSMVALIDFIPSFTTVSLEKLAALTQQTAHAATLNTRAGAIQFVQAACPFVDSTFATISGDPEMLRDVDTGTLLKKGYLDLYTRSKSFDFYTSQTIRLSFDQEAEEFVGVFDYVGQPYWIEKITSGTRNLVYTIKASYEDNLGVISAYSSKESLLICVPDVKDTSGVSVLNPKIDDKGTTYADFTIYYNTDPMLPYIESAVSLDSVRPINSDIKVRGFVPVVIDKFEVGYVRKAGILPDLETAYTRISDYLNNLGYPDVYSDGVISGIMEDCGVKYMRDVSVSAYVQWTVADTVDNREGVTEPVLSTPISTSSGLRVNYPTASAPSDPDAMYAVSPRTLRYFVKEYAISFTELKG